MTQATPTSKDTRPTVAGHPLPWKVETSAIMDVVLDADGNEIINFDEDADGEFWRGLVADVNRLGRMDQARSMVGDDVDEALADIASGKKTRDQVVEENHAAWLRDTGGFVLSTPVIPDPSPVPSIDDHPEGAAVFRFNNSLTKQMTPEEMHEHMQRVILVDLASQQRIAALEALLIATIPAVNRAFAGVAPWADKHPDRVNPWESVIEQFGKLGLAHRLDGNPDEAEQVTS